MRNINKTIYFAEEMGLMKNTLEEITKGIQKMPRISDVTLRLLNKLYDENYSVSDVVKLIEPDVSLSARCLQMVNSPFFGLSNKIISIRLAVNFFGRLNLLSLILMESFKNVFSVSMKLYEEKPGDFWNHSLRTAIATKVLSESMPSGLNSDLAYTAGLLHDMGKVVISDYLEKYSPQIINKIYMDKFKDALETENSVLGTNHAIVGEVMAVKWQLPDYFKAAIRYHHEPFQAPDKYFRLCSFVYAGNIISKLSAQEINADDHKKQFDTDIENKFKFSDYHLDKMILKINNEFDMIKNKLTVALNK